jgi:hypothetical protein
MWIKYIMSDFINPSGVDEILQNEATNLANKLNSVNNTIASEKRIIQLNDSYSKRMSAYTNIVMVFVFALAIAIVIKILKNNTPFVPDAVMSMVYILLASSSIIYSMFLISDIVSREKNDFDKLDLPPPKAVFKNPSKSSKPAELDVTPVLPGYCIGSNCCSVSMATIWDSTSQTCKAGCAPGTYRDSTGGCVSCAIGTSKYSSDTSTCTKCNSTQYTESTGATYCLQCPANKVANADGSGCIA